MTAPGTEAVAEVVTKPSMLRKYLNEYALLALAGCVIYLFYMLSDLNKFIRSQMAADKVELIKTIERNTQALNAFMESQKK